MPDNGSLRRTTQIENETSLDDNSDQTLTDLSDLPLFGGFAPTPSHVEVSRKSTNVISEITANPKEKAPRSKLLKTSVKEPAGPVPKAPLEPKPPRVNVDKESVAIKPELLSVNDVCKLLKISRSTLIRMEKAGLVPGRLVLGGSVRYHLDTIKNWLQNLAKHNS